MLDSLAFSIDDEEFYEADLDGAVIDMFRSLKIYFSTTLPTRLALKRNGILKDILEAFRKRELEVIYNISNEILFEMLNSRRKREINDHKSYQLALEKVMEKVMKKFRS